MESETNLEDASAEQEQLEVAEATSHPVSPQPTPNDNDPKSVNSNQSNTSENPKKRSAETDLLLECDEKMPKLQTFSRFRPRHQLPHQIIALAYTTLMKGDFTSATQSQSQMLHHNPSLSKTLRMLLPWKQSSDREQAEAVSKSAIDGRNLIEADKKREVLLQKIRKIPEVLRMESFGFPIDILVDPGIPLSYDWSIPMGLGRTTGSAAFNRCLLQVAALYPEYLDTVPQLSSEDYCWAVQHECDKSTTANVIAPPIDDVTSDLYQRSKKIDASKTSMIQMKSAKQMNEMLGQFQARAAALRIRQCHLKDYEKGPPKLTTTPNIVSESVSEPKQQPAPSLLWNTETFSSLLVQQGYDDPLAFSSPYDTLY
ncbi:hypothetical protein FisN_15Lh086 [Fistulifera solaris]|uniref:Uncharacterized protein n=1 Tax=Fistulifera solaris TaxID=1519565 RepID=A0A1Z5KAT4_FISSO|nr:hypothetical protein FisN_15Lh086 [Fistulifera solaris]|eukprot:GAX23369.1 hypothetical protein FisN_15Lh086 [Fistulifera solaris]